MSSFEPRNEQEATQRQSKSLSSKPGRSHVREATDLVTWSARPTGLAYSTVPLFASPILLFKNGEPYEHGEAPSVASMFQYSLESVRMSDTNVPIFLITNFYTNSSDSELLRRLNVTRLDAEQMLSSKQSKARALLEEFVSRCPLNGDLFATATVLRYFYLLGAMDHLAVNSLFFLEGDNLLLRPVRELASLYGMAKLGAHASHSHVSLHASFMSIDFVHALAGYAARFVRGQQKCPFDGGGQDMALSYESALELHRELRRRGEGPARIVNAVSGVVPCEMEGRPWRSALDGWCQSEAKPGVKAIGPCAVVPQMMAFRDDGGRTVAASDLPLLYECSRSSGPSNTPRVMGMLQTNLKGRTNIMTPGTSPIYPAMLPWARSPVSSGFACMQEWAFGNSEQHNKAIVFARGRAFTRTVSTGADGRTLETGWLEHFNLHFQGGGCKEQMRPVLVALRRSRLRRRPFTCEGSFNSTARPKIRILRYEECLVTGMGERTVLGLSI